MEESKTTCPKCNDAVQVSHLSLDKQWPKECTNCGAIFDKPKPQTTGQCENTDRELWREKEGDYYAPSIHVTEKGSVGINVDGFVIQMPLRAWHKLAAPYGPPTIKDYGPPND